MRLITRLGIAAVLSVLLAACQVTISRPPTLHYDLTAQGLIIGFDEPASLQRIRVPASGSVTVDVTFRSSAADLRFVELMPASVGGEVSGLRLEVWNESRSQRRLISRSPELFADSSGSALPGLATVSEASTAAIVNEWRCTGPCVAEPYAASTVAVRIVNETSSDRTIRFAAYGRYFGDENEPNGTPGSATQLFPESAGDSFQGAIEFVGDVDYLTVRCDLFEFGNIKLEMRSTFRGDIVMVYGGLEYRPGEQTPIIPCGSTVFVTTRDGTAGPATAARYYLFVD